jgi:PhzF family phenazine biosynthesis protein
MAATNTVKVPFFQVDAFTKEPFKGNPAAVCLMSCELKDVLYQMIAKEMNLLSETAFFEPLKEPGNYKLRWFSPKREVLLCGHATLATAYVLFNELGVKAETISFQTLSGVLLAKKVSGGICLDFPRNDPLEIEPPRTLLKALGLSRCKEILYSETNQKLLVRLDNQEQVLEIQPDFNALLSMENKLGWRGVIVTSTGSEPYDFISRYFAPWMGVNEDPVTGSAHTVLAPYWMRQLGKRKMRAYQASERGGELLVEIVGDRVYITGGAVTVVRGELYYDARILNGR